MTGIKRSKSIVSHVLSFLSPFIWPSNSQFYENSDHGQYSYSPPVVVSASFLQSQCHP